MYVYGFSLKNLIGMRNLQIVFPKAAKEKKLFQKMWFHFGRVIGEYPFR